MVRASAPGYQGTRKLDLLLGMLQGSEYLVSTVLQ